MQDTSMRKINMYKKLIISLFSFLVILNVTLSQSFDDDFYGPCASSSCAPTTPSTQSPQPSYTDCGGGVSVFEGEECYVNCPGGTRAYSGASCPSVATPPINYQAPCPAGYYREGVNGECVGGYDNTQTGGNQVVTPVSPVNTPTAPTSPRAPTSQPIVWTIGYGGYNNPTPNPQSPYTNTNWGSVSGPTGGSQAPVYRPYVPGAPVVNNNPGVTYVNTNWGSVSGPSGPSASAPVYRPTTPTTPVVNTNPQAPYVNTNWGSVSGPVGNAPATTYNTGTTYNQQCQQYYTLQNGQCVQTQKQCQNGQVIGAASTCYKSCSGGNQVPESYNCPVFYNPSVITTTASEINKTSARCNAAARITNSQNYDGYFEYGTTQDLGQVTNRGNIGSAESISYSNVISGLSPDTIYYCRAVITNANGTYKGQIQQFRTKGNEYRYVPPAIQRVTTVVKQETVTKVIKGKTIVTKLPAKKVEKKIVVCQDVEGNKTNLTEGEKFVDIELLKVDNQSILKSVDYKFLYKNKSSINLKNSYIKISVPKEYEYIGNLGKVDGSDVILNIGDIKANESKDYTFKFKIKDDVKVGTSVVTSGYIYYEMLDKDGNDVSDENSTYAVSTISEKDLIGSDLNINKDLKSSKDNSGFSYLFKWLASILLFIILIILGRTIYKNILHKRYKDKVLNAHH